MSNTGHERDDLALEIESLMSVEPSLGFEARVSARVAEMAQTSRGMWRPVAWIPAAGVTAAILVVVWALAWQSPTAPESVAPPVPGNPARQAAAAPMRHAVGGAQTPRVTRAAAPLRITSEAVPIAFAESEAAGWPFVALTAPELTLPDVVIHPDERRAFALVLRRPQDLTPRIDVERASNEQVPQLPPLEPIRLTDIALSPLPALAPLEGD